MTPSNMGLLHIILFMSTCVGPSLVHSLGVTGNIVTRGSESSIVYGRALPLQSNTWTETAQECADLCSAQRNKQGHGCGGWTFIKGVPASASAPPPCDCLDQQCWDDLDLDSSVGKSCDGLDQLACWRNYCMALFTKTTAPARHLPVHQEVNCWIVDNYAHKICHFPETFDCLLRNWGTENKNAISGPPGSHPDQL